MNVEPPIQAKRRFDVGGVALNQPFKIRRLGHFGLNVADMEKGLRFYKDLLGFKIVDIRDPFAGKEIPEKYKKHGDLKGYFFRYGSDHHAFVLYNQGFKVDSDPTGRFRPGTTINQITWQVGSLAEVVNGHHWLKESGAQMVRAGRDMPGSNWHTYVLDHDNHTNEIYYGIEQIGWSGYSKPWSMHYREFREIPNLPQISEFQEVQDALAKGIELDTGYRYVDPMPAKHDVQGVLLPRPFKIVKIGPVGLFVNDLDAAIAFYRDVLGFVITEETLCHGMRCVFLRNNTEHHSLALYPVELRDKLGFSNHTSTAFFGVQLANYRQLLDAISFLKDNGVEILDVPPEFTPGIEYTVMARDPDGHSIQLFFAMDQVGWDGRARPSSGRKATPHLGWPEQLEGQLDSYQGEPFLGPWD